MTIDVCGTVRRPGGGAFYSALQAARLGLRTLVLTRGVERELRPLLAPYARELTVTIVPAEHTTTLLTRGEGRRRRQRVLAWAGPFEEPVEVDTEVLHLAPVARETPRAWRGEAGFVGLTPQGLVREWRPGGEIEPALLERERAPDACDAIALSAEEHERCEGLLETVGSAVVAITAGARPTRVLGRDREAVDIPAFPVDDVRDDLGAGDVFAAAFFVALREGEPPTRAAAFGNAAAAVRIEGAGASAIGDRRAVESRIASREPPTRES